MFRASLFLLLFGPTLFAEYTPDYQEVPYFLSKLKETTLEDKRVEFNKLIHDALVTADLNNKRVVKKIESYLPDLQSAIDAGLDRTNISQQSTWLVSAVNFFKSEKFQKTIDIPESQWMTAQNKAGDKKISTYPDKIILHTPSTSTVIVNSSNIHEAILSPDGKYVAFFRTVRKDADRVHVWVIKLSSLKGEKITELRSCKTILFSKKSNLLFAQEKPASVNEESRIHRFSVKGGKAKPFAQGRLLQTIVTEGDHEGSVIVFKKTVHPLGLKGYECPYAYTPKGQQIARLKGPCR